MKTKFLLVVFQDLCRTCVNRCQYTSCNTNDLLFPTSVERIPEDDPDRSPNVGNISVLQIFFFFKMIHLMLMVWGLICVFR